MPAHEIYRIVLYFLCLLDLPLANKTLSLSSGRLSKYFVFQHFLSVPEKPKSSFEILNKLLDAPHFL